MNRIKTAHKLVSMHILPSSQNELKVNPFDNKIFCLISSEVHFRRENLKHVGQNISFKKIQGASLLLKLLKTKFSRFSKCFQPKHSLNLHIDSLHTVEKSKFSGSVDFQGDNYMDRTPEDKEKMELLHCHLY